jgi:N-terminal domain of galactosyltransferase
VSLWRRFRHKAAACLLDAPRYALALRFPGPGRSWVDLHNRHERALRRPDQRGVALDQPWTSALFYCQANPRVGLQVMRRALAEWPVEWRDAPAAPPQEPPLVSFIIGHRGTARVPHLLATVATIAAQVEVAVDCLVVEQAARPEVAHLLPAWVRHLHTPLPYPEMPYSRSWAFNVGARQVRGRYLVFHDNDVGVPTRYAAELVALFRRGFEAARLQRFVFYLREDHTRQVFATSRFTADRPPERVVQNCQGHTLAVERDAYFAVGGHDEAFLGWGGEDNEMFDRLRTRKLHDCAYLPFVHLYHAPQPGKGGAAHPNTAYFDQRLRTPAAERISELARRGFGSPTGPLLHPIARGGDGL